MKKTISVIVAIAMMLMVSIPAFAGNFDDNADLTAQQKVFAEVIFDGLNAGNNTADTLANYVGSNLDYKADVTSPATITDDVSEAFDAANEKLTVPFTDEALINSMKLRTSATITGRYQAANGEGSSNIGPGGSGSNVLDKLFPDFSNGDFSDLFKGFSDSFSQIGGAISGLLSGLGIGGGRDHHKEGIYHKVKLFKIFDRFYPEDRRRCDICSCRCCGSSRSRACAHQKEQGFRREISRSLKRNFFKTSISQKRLRFFVALLHTFVVSKSSIIEDKKSGTAH